MLGFNTRKKEVVPVVIEPTLQEQLATALSKVKEFDGQIKSHDAIHLEFVRDHGVITDGGSLDNPAVNPLVPPSLSDTDPAEIMREYHDYRLKRNHLQHEFSEALGTWADLKERVNRQQQGRQ